VTASAHHFSFEFRIGIRNRQMLFLMYMFPLVFYLFMGFLFAELDPSFGERLIPAMVIFAILAATLLGMPDSLVKAREDGIYRSYKINGVPSTSILAIPALTTMLHTAVVSLIIIVTAPLLFDAHMPIDWINFAAVFVAVAFASAGLGLLIGVIAPNSRSTVLLSQLVFLPSMLLAGLTIPLSQLPEAFLSISRLLPSTHGMNAFNELAMGNAADFEPWGSVAVLIVGGLLSFALASYLFSWDSQNSTRRGHPALAVLALVPYLAAILLF
jgi:ABC-2 type transport system permease protein